MSHVSADCGNLCRECCDSLLIDPHRADCRQRPLNCCGGRGDHFESCGWSRERQMHDESVAAFLVARSIERAIVSAFR